MKFWKAIRRFFTRCKRCGRRGAERQRQNTEYVNDTQNWVTLCPECAEENAEYWRERWEDHYGGLL